jgi:site-specific DNA-methyltransferase (adenine-specific)
MTGGVETHCGDCLAVLPGLAPDSFDACVTDPPYHLVSIVKRFGKAGSAPINNADEKNGRNGPYHRASAGFMGKQWDGGDVAARPETWAEVYRVLKPGAHLVAFGGTRTYHRLACAIEDAGFEIRDCIFWLYGSGFPKSHDVSKGIDRAGGVSPRAQAAILRQRREAAGMSRDHLAAAIGCTASSVRDWEEGRARAVGAAAEWLIPSEEYRARLAVLLGYTKDERELIGVTLDRRDDGTIIGLGHSGALRSGGNTDAARQWQGWGTALKPACEPIVLARKPLSEGTVAANVLRWGTGAINVDGCRVEGEPVEIGISFAHRGNNYGRGIGGRGTNESYTNIKGRWPANVAHDGSAEVVAGFPDSKSSGGQASLGAFRNGAVYGKGRDEREKRDPGFGDSGSAARFFYTAKADGDERIGSKHPTVKPLDLMQWLVRLVTPKGGTVLDPFAGTGITGEAAWREGAGAVLVEREAEYYADIERRLRLMTAGPDERAREILKAAGKAKGHDDLPLFADRQWSQMWARPFDRPELLDDEAAS